MKQLDTHTVLAIIRMIDSNLRQLSSEDLALQDDILPVEVPFYSGGYSALKKLRSQLQSYIEGQLNAAENTTAE